MASNLRVLANLISSSVDEIDSLLKGKHLTFPSLNDPITPEPEEARSDPAVLQAINVLIAAADQVIATARLPQFSLMDSACGVSMI